MKDLLSLLSSTLDSQAVATISQQISATPQQTQGAINAALPLMMGMMANNCQSKEGCESLARAVETDHSGGILQQAQAFLGQGNIGGGEAILGRIFGQRQPAAEQQLASQTGLQSAQVHKLMALLAPIVLGAIGQQARAQGGANPSNISALLQGSLGSLMKGSGGQMGAQVLGSLLGGAQGGSGQGGNDALVRAGSQLLGSLFKK